MLGEILERFAKGEISATAKKVAKPTLGALTPSVQAKDAAFAKMVRNAVPFKGADQELPGAGLRRPTPATAPNIFTAEGLAEVRRVEANNAVAMQAAEARNAADREIMRLNAPIRETNSYVGTTRELAQQKGLVKDLGLPARVESVVGEKFPGGKHSPEAVQNWVSKQGFKQDEIKWSGVGELIERSVANQKPLTKKDIVEHLEQARIPLEVRKYQSMPEGTLTGQERTILHEHLTPNYRLGSDLGGPATDHMEITITAPSIKPEFKGGHYSTKQTNTIGYARGDIRKTDKGESALFVSNLQSDWHIATTKYGEQGKLDPGIEIALAPKKNEKGQDIWWARDKKTEEILNIDNNKEKLLQKFDGKTPPFPFKKNWSKIVIKALIKEAIDKDLDGIMLTSGDRIRGRWGISSQWNPNAAYDKQFINDFNEVGAKWGAKATKRSVDVGPEHGNIKVASDITWDEVYKVYPGNDLAKEAERRGQNPATWVANYATLAERKIFRQSGGSKFEEFPYFPVTPQLKEAFKKGKIFMWGLAGATTAGTAISKKESN